MSKHGTGSSLPWLLAALLIGAALIAISLFFASRLAPSTGPGAASAAVVGART